MANTLKRNTGLPVNLWIDCGQSYKKSGHHKQIKFQKDHSDRINNNFATMKLDGEIVQNTNHGSRLSPKEEDMVKNFVINNRKCLELLCDQQITMVDFSRIMITGGEPASEIEKEIQERELDKIL